MVFVKLAYVQIIQGKWLQIKASEQWSRDLPINAKRGDVFDSNGVVLAQSYTTYDVYVRPSMVKDAGNVSLLLSSILNLDFESTLSKVNNIKHSEVLIKLQVKEDQAKILKESNLSGIKLSENNARHYPFSDLATQLLGFTTIDNVGQAGIEAKYDKYLKGVNGKIIDQSDVKGVQIDNTLSKYIPSIDGCDVTLTIDVNIQQSLEQSLVKLMQEQKPKTATGIVMNTKTGEIVAVSSKPSFDLNNPPRHNVDELLNNVRNMAITDIYEPGSTFKVLTMAAALDSGVAKLTDTFYDPGYRVVDNERIKCWKSIGHGHQTLSDGLCNSCNSIFVDLSLRLGYDKMYEYFEKFGLGNTLGVDFLAEASGIIMNKDTAKIVDLARMGFGQAIATSPLQLITAVNSVLNGGYLMKPYLVKEVRDVTGKIILSEQPSVIKRTVSSDTSSKMQVMFEEVVDKFSAIEAFIPGYRVGGKTGTTQKYIDGRIGDKYISSFIGAFPANDPEYTILILADEPSSGHFFGSIVATPYAKPVFEDIIKFKNYQPVGLEDDLIAMQKNIEMPNLVGKRLADAITILRELCLQFKLVGEGYYISNQTPSPGTYVYKNAIVILTTE